MAPADRVSAHDLPLAKSLSAIGVEREKYHNITLLLFQRCNESQSLLKGDLTANGPLVDKMAASFSRWVDSGQQLETG